jgi:hypothetical protein
LLNLTPPPAPGTFSVVVEPSVSNVRWGPDTIGTLADSTRVEIKVTGILGRSWADHSMNGAYAGVYIGPWDAMGTYTNCYNAVLVRAPMMYGYPFCDGSLGPVNVRTKLTTMRGPVSVEWNKKPPLASTGQCDQVGGLPCHTFTGTFTVTVTPTSQYLSLTASPTTVEAGDSVTFTPSVASGKTYTVLSWTWAPNDSSTSFTVCGTAATCRIAAYGSGTMYLRAKVRISASQSQVEQAKAAVTVEPCDPVVLAILQEYPARGVAFAPTCSDFTTDANSDYFIHSEYNHNGFHTWAIARQTLRTGADGTRVSYNAPLIVSSGYRCPDKQYGINPGAIVGGRHMNGDAIDFDTGDSQTVWDAMKIAAKANGACVEPITMSTVDHVHADWRGTCPNSNW